MKIEPLDNELKRIAVDAALLMKSKGIDSEDLFGMVLDGILKVPEQMQGMVDTIVIMQKDFPMPKWGWEAFIRDLEYTNQKHNLNLHIKPELLGGQCLESV